MRNHSVLEGADKWMDDKVIQSKIICPFFGVMVNEGFMNPYEYLSLDMLRILMHGFSDKFRVGDPGSVIMGTLMENFGGMPFKNAQGEECTIGEGYNGDLCLSPVTAMDMEGFPIEHHRSTGIHDVETDWKKKKCKDVDIDVPYSETTVKHSVLLCGRTKKLRLPRKQRDEQAQKPDGERFDKVFAAADVTGDAFVSTTELDNYEVQVRDGDDGVPVNFDLHTMTRRSMKDSKVPVVGMKMAGYKKMVKVLGERIVLGHDEHEETGSFVQVDGAVQNWPVKHIAISDLKKLAIERRFTGDARDVEKRMRSALQFAPAELGWR